MTNPYQSPEDEYSGDETRYHGQHEGPDYDEAREYWPTCPDCGKRLTITCPFCKTTDNLFPLGDTEYWGDDLGGSLVEYQKRIDRQYSSRSVLFGEGDTSMPLDEHNCSCNKMGKTPGELYVGTQPELTGGHTDHSCCGEHGYDCHDNTDEESSDLPERNYDSESLPFVVICPTCGEAFIPSFPGGCSHCRYVWDKSKPLDAQEAVIVHKKTANPALEEIGGSSFRQWVIGIVILVIIAAIGAVLLVE